MYQSIQATTQVYHICKGCNTLQITFRVTGQSGSYVDVFGNSSSNYLGRIAAGSGTQNFSVSAYDYVLFVAVSGVVAFDMQFIN